MIFRWSLIIYISCLDFLTLTQHFFFFMNFNAAVYTFYALIALYPFNLSSSLSLQEEELRHLEARRGLELQGLQPHEAAWPQERALLQQEVRLFRQNAIIVYMKLRWILMHWRLGRRTDADEDGAEVRPNVEIELGSVSS